MGIDYGGKRVGVAISDEDLKLAFPLEVLENSPELISELKELSNINNIGMIVVGESKDFSGQDNKIMEEIRPFVQKLTDELRLEVESHPEFMTSQAAERFQGKNEMHDASAAALILQSYLDTKNNKEKNGN